MFGNFLDYTSVGVGFPGFGIEEFRIDRAAFSVRGHDIMWYGIIITLGMILAVTYVMYRCRQYKGITTDDILDFAIFIVIFGVIGARLYYVITSDTHYSFVDAFKIWEGGLAIYGGIIAGGITLLCVCKYKKLRPQCLLDMCTPAVMLGQFIGRWGNFCNGEAFGAETSLPWRMELTHYYPNGYANYIGCMHPTFLYESLWNLIGFILINIFYKKRKFDGQVALEYFAWYGFGRMLIEGLRTDSLYVGKFRISQIVGLVSFLCASALIVFFWNKAKRYDSASYKAVVITDEDGDEIIDLENDPELENEKINENESTLFSDSNEKNEDNTEEK